MTQSKPTRRTYLIDRGFQLKYTGLLVLCGALISVVFGTLAYLAEVDVHRNLAEELTRGGGAAADPMLVSSLVKQSATTLLMLTIAVTLLMSIALALVGILITHRIAGPVHVMSNYVSALAEGRYPLLRPLRRNDELQEFFDRFRMAIDSLRRAEEADTAAILEAVSELKASVSAANGSAALERLLAICERRRVAVERAALNPVHPTQPAAEAMSISRG